MARMLAEPQSTTYTPVGSAPMTGPVAGSPVAPPQTPTGKPVLAPATPPSPAVRKKSARRRPAPAKNRNLGWWSKEMIAVLTTSFIVSLLCFYVAAYARVTAAGFELSRLNRKIRAAEAEEQALLAAIGNLRAPNTVASRALKMEMVPGEPQTLNLVTPQTVPQNASATQDVPSLPEGETVRNNTISPGANRQ